MVTTRYQILTQRYMTCWGNHTRKRMVWTFCGKAQYDRYRRTTLTANRARKLLIERGKKTLVVHG